MTLQEILDMTRSFADRLKQNEQKATFHDYERYKHLLHCNGIYGHEKDIADILNL